jgi:uncharacterized protein YjiS (DUF1127 family)
MNGDWAIMNLSNVLPAIATWRPAPGPWSGFARVVREAAWLATHWLHRARSRRALLMLNDRELRDIGLSRDEAQREAVMPFWR